MILNFDYFTEFEIDLTGVCNLRCDRCSRNYLHSQHLKKMNIRPLQEIKDQLDQFKNLKKCMLAGQVSEPTLYPEFLDFLHYLKRRSIQVQLFTNASILDAKLFDSIGKILSNDDFCMFTICGTTQKLHETYRIGSKLENILKNAEALRNRKPIDILQYIRFTYNLDDWKSNKWKSLGFTKAIWVESEGDRWYNNTLRPRFTKPVKDALYKKIFDSLRNDSNLEIKCKCLDWHKIYIDQFGNLGLCYSLVEYHPNEFNNLNVSEILAKQYECCKLCSTKCNLLQKQFDLDFVC